MWRHRPYDDKVRGGLCQYTQRDTQHTCHFPASNNVNLLFTHDDICVAWANLILMISHHLFSFCYCCFIFGVTCDKFSLNRSGPFGGSCQIHGPIPIPHSESDELSHDPDCENNSSGCGGVKSPVLNNPAFSHTHCPPEVHRSCFCVRFIAEHTKLLEDSTKVSYIFANMILYLFRLDDFVSRMDLFLSLACVGVRRWLSGDVKLLYP